MNKRLVLTVLLTVMFSLTMSANPDHHEMMNKKLKLTETQDAQFKKISFDMKKKQIELKAKSATAALELKQLMSADAIDKSAIEKKLSEIASIRVALRMNHINAWSEKNKVLNADQQKIWKKMLQNGPRMKHGKRGNRMMMEHRMHDDDQPRMERRIEKKIIKE